MRVLMFLIALAPLFGQAPPARPAAPSPAPAPTPFGQGNSQDQVLKALDDLEWRMKLGDIADVDKIVYASLPPAHNPNPTGPGAGNPLIIHAYTFIPKKLDRTKKQPLLVLAHQAIH